MDAFTDNIGNAQWISLPSGGGSSLHVTPCVSRRAQKSCFTQCMMWNLREARQSEEVLQGQELVLIPDQRALKPSVFGPCLIRGKRRDLLLHCVEPIPQASNQKNKQNVTICQQNWRNLAFYANLLWTSQAEKTFFFYQTQRQPLTETKENLKPDPEAFLWVRLTSNPNLQTKPGETPKPQKQTTLHPVYSHTHNCSRDFQS